MPLQHGEFIKYMQRLGYRSNREGICFGIAHMGLQAILSEDLESFEKHLQDIEEDISNGDRLGKLIAKEDIRKMEGMTEEEIQKLTDIRAFCDGVELYFQPERYKNLFQEDARPFSQDATKTSPLIDSIKMTEQQGLYQAAIFSGVYEERELVELLKSLKGKIQNDYNKPIALIISSMKHAICVGYIPNLQEWVFFDANNLPPKRLNEESLAKEIRRRLSNTKKIILTNKVYSTKNNIERVDNLILGWKNSKTYERIQTVTDEKARYVNNRNQTWLHHSAQAGDFLLAKDLLLKAVNIDAIDANGWSALMLTAQMGHLGVLNALIEMGADVNLSNVDGRTALMLAARFGRLEVVKILINNGANVDARRADGRTALMMAAYFGHLEVVKALIQGGANVDVMADKGFTALMLAAQMGHLEVVKALIEIGADVNLSNVYGLTPLMQAAYFGHLEVVKALIQGGANIDARRADGWSALMFAARNGHFRVVRELIAQGANVNMKDKSGKTTLELASPELREAMLKQIATQNETASRKKLTFSNASVEEADSNISPTVSHKPPTSKP